jgi:hypothetical protein
VSVATNQLTDDSTGNMFRLMEQPSGHTASIMLPAKVPMEWNKPACPSVAPLLVGPGVTYAAAVAPGTVHQVAAATRGEDFTFTRKTPPPAAVPSGVDSGRGAAISTASTLHHQPPPQPGRPPSVATPTCTGEIIATFQDVLNPKGDLQRTSENVAHHLQTRGPPIASKFRWLDSEKLAAAKKELLALEQAGIVRRSTSPWASQLHMLRKQDGTWRPCGNYHCLNSVTVPDTYRYRTCWISPPVQLGVPTSRRST